MIHNKNWTDIYKINTYRLIFDNIPKYENFPKTPIMLQESWFCADNFLHSATGNRCRVDNRKYPVPSIIFQALIEL